MRALVVHPGADFSVADVFDGWVKGLKDNGVEVATLNLSDRLNFYGKAKLQDGDGYRAAFDNMGVVRMASLGIKAAVYDFWPDVIFIVSAFFVPPDFYPIFRDRGHKVVILHTESPYEDDNQIQRAEYAHLNILNDPTNLEKFQEVGKSIYIPHGFDPERHFPRPSEPEYESDFCFVGTGYPSRIRFFEQIDWTGIDATFAGNWQATSKESPLRRFVPHPIDECCPNSETVRLYASTKVSANLYRQEAQRPELAEGWAMTPREVELAACGVYFLREPRGEGNDLLPRMPIFHGPNDFEDLLRWSLANPEVRELATFAARRAVHDRTFANNAAKALQAIA